MVAGIIPAAVQSLGASPQDTFAFFGPHAQQLEFDTNTPGLEPGFLEKHRAHVKNVSDQRVRINLGALARDQILSLGIRSKNIVISNADTLTDPRYYSHRNRYQKATETGQPHPEDDLRWRYLG